METGLFQIEDTGKTAQAAGSTGPLGRFCQWLDGLDQGRPGGDVHTGIFVGITVDDVLEFAFTVNLSLSFARHSGIDAQIG